MFCIKCGSEMNDGAKFCASCGNPVETVTNVNESVTNEVKTEVEVPVQNVTNNVSSNVNNYDKFEKGLAAGSLIFPPFGIVYFFISKKDLPNRAKSALKSALIGLVVYVVAALTFIFIILPLEKRYLLKYECTYNTPGSTYDYSSYTCTHPDGTKDQKIPK